MAYLNARRVMTPGGPMIVPTGLRWNTAGVLPPPNAFVGNNERLGVLQMQAQRTPYRDAFARYLSERGDKEIWFDFARQYRQTAGLIPGLLGTGLMAAAMGVAALRSGLAKGSYRRARPYQVDPRVLPIVGEERSPSYPSGHATASSAAATVLSLLWPMRAQEFEWWADQVAASRVYGGVHYPSDVITGAKLGKQVGLHMAGWIRS